MVLSSHLVTLAFRRRIQILLLTYLLTYLLTPLPPCHDSTPSSPFTPGSIQLFGNPYKPRTYSSYSHRAAYIYYLQPHRSFVRSNIVDPIYYIWSGTDTNVYTTCTLRRSSPEPISTVLRHQGVVIYCATPIAAAPAIRVSRADCPCQSTVPSLTPWTTETPPSLSCL